MLACVSAAIFGCASFDGPPEVTIQGEKEGLVADAKAPIVLAFSKPPVPATVKIEIAKYVVDGNGLLADEPGNTLDTQLDPLFTYDPVNGDTGGTGLLAADGSTLTITLKVPPPVGAQYVVLVEPGLSDEAGTVTKVRRRLVYGYASNLHCDMPAHVFQSGTYFFLVAVDEPIAVQIQLFSNIDLDAATGHTMGRFTKAKRNTDPSRCHPACPSTDACRLLPGPPTCVTPSTPAGSVDEFSDYVPNPSAPTGFSFENTGCAVDHGDSSSEYASEPVDVMVTMPPVTLRNAALSSSFTAETDGTLRGTGSLSADAVLLGIINSGVGHGNLTARSIPPGSAPPGIPAP